MEAIYDQMGPEIPKFCTKSFIVFSNILVWNAFLVGKNHPFQQTKQNETQCACQVLSFVFFK